MEQDLVLGMVAQFNGVQSALQRSSMAADERFKMSKLSPPGIGLGVNGTLHFSRQGH